MSNWVGRLSIRGQLGLSETIYPELVRPIIVGYSSHTCIGDIQSARGRKANKQPASRKMMEAANDVCKAEEEENNQEEEGDMSNDEGIGGCDVEEITEDEERKVKMKRKPSWFGRVLMFFVTNKQQKMARRQKSLISRNRRGTGFNASMKRIRQRTMSMVSLVSTNCAESRYIRMYEPDSKENSQKTINSNGVRVA